MEEIGWTVKTDREFQDGHLFETEFLIASSSDAAIFLYHCPSDK
jgi:hypothetical protein